MKMILLLVAIVIPAASHGQILVIGDMLRECGAFYAAGSGPSQVGSTNGLGLFQITKQENYAGTDYVVNAYADLDSNLSLSGDVRSGVAGDGLSVCGTGNCDGSLNLVSGNTYAYEQLLIQVDFAIDSPCNFTNRTTTLQPSSYGNETFVYLVQNPAQTNFVFVFGNDIDGISGPSSGSASGTVLAGSYQFRVESQLFSFPPVSSDSSYFDTYFSVSPISPVLNIDAIGGEQAQITWSTNYINFTLESTLTLSAARWQTVTNRVVVAGQQCSVTVDTVEATRFFRLLHY